MHLIRVVLNSRFPWIELDEVIATSDFLILTVKSDALVRKFFAMIEKDIEID